MVTVTPGYQESITYTEPARAEPVSTDPPPYSIRANSSSAIPAGMRFRYLSQIFPVRLLLGTYTCNA